MSLPTRLKDAWSAKAAAAPLRIHARQTPYEATSTNRRVADWDTLAYGPNAALDDAATSRARAQDAQRNNPWLRRAIRLIVSHQIGCGLQPRPKFEDPDRRAEVLALWEVSAAELDADGVYDAYGLQQALTRARLESGEVFARLRYRRPGDGLAVPLQLQLLEADLCPLGYNDVTRNIRQGIERSRTGQRRRYWMHREHPRETWMPPDPNRLTGVPAEEILHHYLPDRPGQLRGAPEGLSTLVRARNLDHFESAELNRKKHRARFVGTIHKENPEDNPITDAPANPVLVDYQNQLAAVEASAEYAAEDPAALAQAAELRDRILQEQERKTFVDVEDGYLLQLALHERADLAHGDAGGANDAAFMRSQLQGIAAGWGVPYELLSGDYTGANDRIMRVVLNVFYRELEFLQDHLVAQVLRPLWERWLDAAVWSGALRLPGYETDPRPWRPVEWRAHAWSYVNPLQEAQTAILRIQNGLTDRSSVVAESGWDAEDVDRRQAADRERETELGLTYGGDTPVARKGPEPRPNTQEADDE
jgi:lambda family phage portal protein